MGLIEAYQSKLRTDLIQMVLSAKWGPPKVAVTATGLTLIWTDGGYGGKLMAWGQDICGWRLEIVTGWDEVTEFKVVAKDGWLNLHLLGWIGIVDGVKTLKFG